MNVSVCTMLTHNLHELNKREQLNVHDIISHEYLRRVFRQYELFGLRQDTLVFVTITALGSISNRSFIKNSSNLMVLLNQGSLLVGKTGMLGK
ncbi:unnamed protein product [Adineta steineri]|uniref:Uncharacterized protein n=1 Tax=Adineta steineri TaxID=433720 RepID=A0A816CMI7_9BILA|nr:unnamed protein product [Adineta steineri]CAF1626379.1 unnamed protein product [Adineta steineri]